MEKEERERDGGGGGDWSNLFVRKSLLTTFWLYMQDVDNFNISLFPRERALSNNQQTLKRR